jgi:hypothetical protein
MIIQKQNLQVALPNKMFVVLGSTIDHNKWSSFSKNEAAQESLKPEGMVYYEVSSLKEASLLTQKFIDLFKLGSSNWTGGKICDENFNFIAHISYNGRIWDNEDWKIAKEIKIC